MFLCRPRGAVPRALLVLAVAVALGALAPGSRPGVAAQAPPAPRFLVEAAGLPAVLATAAPERPIVLLAARSLLESAQPGLVAGAQWVDVDEWLAASATPQALLDLDGWARRIGALGIDNASRVVVYDDGELKFASRVRFLLGHYGVGDASLLNGGYDGLEPLIQAGRLARATAPVVPAPRAFQVHVAQTPIRLVFRDEVAAALGDPGIAIVDVRPPAEYDGRVRLPGDERSGHIPGARNLPLAEYFDPEQPTYLLPPDALRQRFEQAGLRPAQPVIVYCHDGAQSSLAALAMVDAGYTNVSLYYNSFENWSQDFALPVAQ
jgi:thiosulfate/3-mercaptopyruvate sulfurtransferase